MLTGHGGSFVRVCTSDRSVVPTTSDGLLKTIKQKSMQEAALDGISDGFD